MDEWRENVGGETVTDERRQKVEYIPCSTNYFDIIICDYWSHDMIWLIATDDNIKYFEIYMHPSKVIFMHNLK